MARPVSGADKAAALAEDHGDHIDHLLQALHGNWGLAETYVQGNATLRLDFWIRTDDGDRHLKHKVAVFQRAPGFDLHVLGRRSDMSEFYGPQGELLSVPVDGRENGRERPVLVCVGEFAESGQSVDAWAVESVVWLAEFDELDDLGVDASDASLPSFALAIARIVRRQVVEDWKRVAKPRLTVIGNDGLPEKMIERGPEVMEEVTDDDAPTKWQLIGDADTADIAGIPNVYFGNDSIDLGVRFKELSDGRIEGFKMEFCSL